MDEKVISEKEYEALATVSDILAILYAEICENLGRDSDYLSEAYNYVSGLSAMAYQDLQ